MVKTNTLLVESFEYRNFRDFASFWSFTNVHTRNIEIVRPFAKFQTREIFVNALYGNRGTQNVSSYSIRVKMYLIDASKMIFAVKRAYYCRSKRLWQRNFQKHSRKFVPATIPYRGSYSHEILIGLDELVLTHETFWDTYFFKFQALSSFNLSVLLYCKIGKQIENFEVTVI